MNTQTGSILRGLEEPIESLRDIGRRFYARGWSVGTSSNYSVVVQRDPTQLLVTASGMDKGQLTVVEEQPKSSAETMLHVALANHPVIGKGVGSVLHTHSIWGTLLSDLDFDRGELRIGGYEMLKGLDGITTHDTEVAIKIFDNTQDIASLAAKLTELLSENDPALRHGFLMRGHGLYTWGSDVDAARRHVEVLEFLFEVVGRTRTLNPIP